MVMSIYLAGCSPQDAPVPTVAPALEPSATVLPTVAATATALPTEIPEPTATPLPTETPAPTATPLPDFENGKITSIEARGENILWMLSLTGVTTPLEALVDGKTYDCSLEPDYPDRLFCFGPAFTGDPQQITAAFYSAGGGGLAIFEGTYFLPVILPTAMPAGDPTTWCPERGQDVFCETEHRIDKFGNACMVASCFDACGYYYSIHTCPKPWSEYAP